MRSLAEVPARRQRRIEMRQEATLINSDGRDFLVYVKDLSRAGFTLEHRAQDLRLGEIVIIRSHHGTEARCQIKWTTEFEAGGVFIELPIMPD
ncbi:MAG: PilZ domain-containing protein [Sphingomonas sp.]|nr:PilZ domain-containing protein [Sphingomonas sp.]